MTYDVCWIMVSHSCNLRMRAPVAEQVAMVDLEATPPPAAAPAVKQLATTFLASSGSYGGHM